ncbi:hypothetical protein HHL17_16435 [Chitinophaga sp. G-6-1-13]|uniref:Outer membrane protein beta-barrel domain-containing protein n=1 Tax=Chitinophaga fulva TaxID=2728842 RepID=A0A848GLJ1_9BACT|nr:hypothetical protein [Chitinophaga fulva]NML38797.1 hypothetical protein [Chitinophaga fulva]
MLRTIFLAGVFMSAMAAKAQTVPVFGAGHRMESAFGSPQRVNDTSNVHKKWFTTKYVGISTGVIAFNGGSSSFMSVPLGLQLNRQLTNNLFAFGGVSVTPYVFRYNNVPYQPAINKNSGFMQTSNVAAYSDAKVGIMYISNDRTFSISGSIGVGRGTYQGYSPFYAPMYAPMR